MSLRSQALYSLRWLHLLSELWHQRRLFRHRLSTRRNACPCPVHAMLCAPDANGPMQLSVSRATAILSRILYSVGDPALMVAAVLVLIATTAPPRTGRNPPPS